jgi:very-short-patch-repair endonuclease
MTKIYNKISEKEKRRLLRNNTTRAEEYLWESIRNKKIEGYRFLRQYSVGYYVLDFYCPSLKLAIEVDGATHLTKDEKEYDKNRQSEIENLNIKFLRFTNKQIINNLSKVVEEIKDRVKRIDFAV